jgi:protein SCO1/2
MARRRATKYLLLAAVLLALNAPAARSALAPADLERVEVTPPPGAHIPTASRWRDESGAWTSLGQATDGRPGVLIFADYTCASLCGPVLTFAADALAKSGLSPSDYRLVALGIDPKDGPADAARMKKERIGDAAIASSAVFLTGDAQTIREATEAVGYHFAYDAAHDQFAHPAAVLVLAPDGRITRVLEGLGISADDFRLALVEAGEGRIGAFKDRVRLLCYGFDPSTGMYTVSIYRALAAASALTIVLLAAGIGWLSLRRSGPS